MKQYRQCESKFNIDRHLVKFLNDSAFYAALSRHVIKIPTKDIPTAAIGYEVRSDRLLMWYNPDFMASLNDTEVKGVIRHEYNHVVFGHVGVRSRQPFDEWNIAADLANNSIIVHGVDGKRHDNILLPKLALIPGEWPQVLDENGKPLDEEKKKANKLASLIAQFPILMPSEWYFDKIHELVEKNPEMRQEIYVMSDEDGEDGEDGTESGDDEGNDSNGQPKSGKGKKKKGFRIGTLDEHGQWQDLPEEHRERIQNKIKAVIAKAAREADQTANGWGSIPANVRETIRRAVSNNINWRMVLRQFFGSLIRGERTSSIKRINRRYPYVHPGTKRGHTAKLLIAVDQSGSVSDELLTEFHGELVTLTKKVDIDFLPFDCSCDVKDVIPWRKNSMPFEAGVRHKSGGTDFNAPTMVFNDPKNRGRWDGLLILTDGLAPEPVPCRGKRGWVLGANDKLAFTSSEMQVFVSKDRPPTGAWW